MSTRHSPPSAPPPPSPGGARNGRDGRDARDPRDARERSPYTRFIPREELNGLGAFNPATLGEAFDGGVPQAPQRPWPPVDLPLPNLADAAEGGAATGASDFNELAGFGAAASQPAMPSQQQAPRTHFAPADFDAVHKAQTSQTQHKPGSGAGPAARNASQAGVAEQLSQLQAHLRSELRAELRQELRAELVAELGAELEAAQAESQHAAMQAARQGGYQDGYRDGLEALESFKSSYAQQVTAQIGQVLGALDGELRKLESRTADSLARVAVVLARHVVRAELKQRPETIVQVAQEAVASVLADARHLSLRVHPDDQALVAEGCADLLAERGGHVRADPDIERGGCAVETEVGGIDATVAARWAAALRTLGDSTPWKED